MICKCRVKTFTVLKAVFGAIGNTAWLLFLNTEKVGYSIKMNKSNPVCFLKCTGAREYVN